MESENFLKPQIRGLEKTTITLKNVMDKVERNPDFTGIALADDFVFALGLGTKTDKEFLVLQSGITGFESTLETETKDSAYLRAGKSTTKTGTQRKFKFDGDYFVGDTTIEKILELKYKNGDFAIVDYIYVNMITGKGEKGKVSVVVKKDGGGNPSENAKVEFEFMKVGEQPENFEYSEE